MIESNYSALSELMHYYHMEFFVSIVTLIIMLMLTVKAALHASGQHPSGKMHYFDLAIGFFILAANIGSVVFQGALLDISQGESSSWLNGILLISALNFFAFIALLVLRKRK